MCFIAFLVVFADTSPAFAQNTNGALGVMTYNVNEGTDYLQVLSATTAEQFLIGVGDIVTQVQGTNPPERMLAIAAKILAAHSTRGGNSHQRAPGSPRQSSPPNGCFHP